MSDNLLIFKKNYYTNKNIYISNLQLNFKNSLEILNNIKKNFINNYIIFNGVHKQTYLSFLLSIQSIKKKYMKIILLLMSHISFAKPIEMIKKDLDSNYHIIFNKKSIRYNITFHCLANQFFCQTDINIFKLNKYSQIIEDLNCNLSITLDLNNSEPVLFNVSL
jgi:hypothetical protein